MVYIINSGAKTICLGRELPKGVFCEVTMASFFRSYRGVVEWLFWAKKHKYPVADPIQKKRTILQSFASILD